METLFRILFVIAILIVLMIVLIISYNVYAKQRKAKMYKDVYDALNSLKIKSRENEFEIKRTSGEKAYDYTFKTPTSIFYIKVVPNFSNYEICINNSVKWQIRKSFGDDSLNFVEGVENLMRMEFSEKNAKKLYIIYPNAKALLKYINECEMVFVKPETNIYGASVISYQAIKDIPNILEIIENKKEI